jgi:murein DD-endopeptidase MepM/ murein hydrolase activator NlpD
MKQPKMVVEKPVYAYKKEVRNYFEAPQLPERFWNAEPKKQSTKNKKKRIKSAKAQKALPHPLAMNPVLGATKRSIISFFGDARDGGGRKHEGIDIVAPKGTMVVAPCDGEITEVGYNSLGGKVIRMRDLRNKCNYYFAHLDSQIVTKGMYVKPGDTLGTVGNTGNARHTRSHLHFGIYKNNGRTSVDYIKTKEQVLHLLASE